MVLRIFARSEASYSVRLSLFTRSKDELDALDEGRLSDELEADDGRAADSDAGNFGEEKLDLWCLLTCLVCLLCVSQSRECFPLNVLSAGWLARCM